MNKKELALKWLNAFNSKDIETIMACYHPKIVHVSPKIGRYFPKSGNTLKGKTLVENYFRQALQNNPTLHFELRHILVGDRSVVLFYQRIKNDLVGEFLEFDDNGLIIRSHSNYKAIEP